MKQKKIILIAIIIVAVVVSFAYIKLKHTRYNRFLVAVQALPFELKLGEFYAQHLRFPRSSEEYVAFANEDREYGDRLNIVGCHVKYDSLKEAIILYSPGFDGDDDNLLKTYNPNEVNFASSLVKDGDVFLQIETVVDFLYVLQHRFIALRENKPDSTLKPIKLRLWNLAKCYVDTVISVEELERPIPTDASSEYGETWFEFRKINGITTLQLYSELDPLLIRRVERGFLSEVNKQGILREADNVAIGFTINLLSWPQYCQPASTRLP